MMNQSLTLALAPLLLPAIPKSIVCSICKLETGFTKEDILTMEINEDICCPNCTAMIYSCIPQMDKKYGVMTYATWVAEYGNGD